MGFRSIFNLLGPLTNPAGTTAQILGVYHPDLTEKMAKVLNRLETQEAFVVCGEGTFDEISICGSTRVSHLKNGEINTFNIKPEDFEKEVLIATFKIPFGKVSTYKRIAEKINRPKAYRAVGNALHKNPLAPTIPCHRVVKSDGGFGGDKINAMARIKLLEKEGLQIDDNRVKMSEENVV